MRPVVLFILLILNQTAGIAQDSLVLKTGQRIPFTRMAMYDGLVEIKHEETKEFHTYPFEEVYGYSEGMKEKTYFFKPNPESEEDDDYLVVKRLLVGNLSLFEGTGNNQSLYVEKGGEIKKVFEVTESKYEKGQRFEILKSFVSDDDESMAYLSSPDFRLKWKEIEKVVEYYNDRNYDKVTPKKDDVKGMVYLYRTQFQKTKDRIVIELHNNYHDLYIEDYIMLELPIDYASQLSLRDAEIKSTHILSGELIEQYFEVLYNSKTNTFRFDKKSGTELQYEFYKIRDMVGKKINHD